ncbi:MAG: hypothetical protein R3C04_09120 [Hyphomonas sp.]
MFEAFEDCIENPVDVFEKVDVPEADDVPAFFLKKRGSDVVVSPLAICAVTVAIQFDDQFYFKAGKVRKIRPDRMLSPELPSAQLTIAEFRPEKALGKR